MENKRLFDSATQFALPALTVGAQVAIAMKYPQYGLIINLAAQPFWLYSSWKSWREAGQIGILITTIIITVVLTFGIINYWVM